jgi:diadenosine tetraphosphate (Ap4A) HIT family hydrolase
MIGGGMLHYRKTKLNYKKHNAADRERRDCTFCREETQRRIVGENDTMFVIPNRVSYDMFEGRKVIDHVMVIPKAHHESFQVFNDKEKIDAMTIIAEYEAKGYNVYARGVGSPSRSVKHQHTHLIKMIDKPSNLIIYARKPYLLVDI